jgi:hypothetical protein
MKQYAEKIVKALQKVLKKPVSSKAKVDMTENMKKFMKSYMGILHSIGITDFNALNSRLDSDTMAKMAYKYAVSQVQSGNFAKSCMDGKCRNLDECMRCKMGENVIDNLCLLIPMKALRREESSVKLSEAINYSNSVSGYQYMYRLMCAMDGSAKGNETYSDNPELQEQMRVYSQLKEELARYY